MLPDGVRVFIFKSRANRGLFFGYTRLRGTQRSLLDFFPQSTMHYWATVIILIAPGGPVTADLYMNFRACCPIFTILRGAGEMLELKAPFGDLLCRQDSVHKVVTLAKLGCEAVHMLVVINAPLSSSLC